MNILGCISHVDDDVKAVAAEALQCLVPIIMKEKEELFRLLGSIWNAFLEQDDLSTSISFIMELLWKVYSVESQHLVEFHDEENFSLNLMIPRLYPFIRHTASVVKSSVLSTINQLLRSPVLRESLKLPDLLCLLFQNLLLEESTASSEFHSSNRLGNSRRKLENLEQSIGSIFKRPTCFPCIEIFPFLGRIAFHTTEQKLQSKITSTFILL